MLLNERLQRRVFLERTKGLGTTRNDAATQHLHLEELLRVVLLHDELEQLVARVQHALHRVLARQVVARHVGATPLQHRVKRLLVLIRRRVEVVENVVQLHVARELLVSKSRQRNHLLDLIEELRQLLDEELAVVLRHLLFILLFLL